MFTESTTIDNKVEAFASQLQGQLISPGDADYQEARHIWNGMIDKYPAMIARCMGKHDVATAVAFARENDLLLSVRGGGHNVAGHATNNHGLVIDLSPMNSVQVDREARSVHVGGGAKLGNLDRETQKYGLAPPAGVVSDTGIAGLTLGGGLGYLRNKYGLTCDNLISAKVVTADGRFLTASEFVAMYAGSVADGERAMQPMRDFRQPLLDFSGPMTYLDAQTFFDEDYPSAEMRYYWKSPNLMHLDDAVIERIIEHTFSQPSPYSTTDIWHIGGTVTQVVEKVVQKY